MFRKRVFFAGQRHNFLGFFVFFVGLSQVVNYIIALGIFGEHLEGVGRIFCGSRLWSLYLRRKEIFIDKLLDFGDNNS